MANPGQVKGQLIGLTIGGSFVSCETNCEFNYDVEMLPASSVTSGKFKEFISGMISWNMTVNGNLLLKTVAADFKSVLNMVLTGEEVALEFKTRGGITPYFIIAGNAIPQSGNVGAPNVGKANWTINFQGTGPFTTDFEEFWLIINAMPPDAEYPLIVETDPAKW